MISGCNLFGVEKMEIMKKLIKKSHKCAGFYVIREVLKAKEISNHHSKPLKAIWSIEQQKFGQLPFISSESPLVKLSGSGTPLA